MHTQIKYWLVGVVVFFKSNLLLNCAGDPRRPYPTDLEMRSGTLGQLSHLHTSGLNGHLATDALADGRLPGLLAASFSLLSPFLSSIPLSPLYPCSTSPIQFILVFRPIFFFLCAQGQYSALHKWGVLIDLGRFSSFSISKFYNDLDIGATHPTSHFIFKPVLFPPYLFLFGCRSANPPISRHLGERWGTWSGDAEQYWTRRWSGVGWAQQGKRGWGWCHVHWLKQQQFRLWLNAQHGIHDFVLTYSGIVLSTSFSWYYYSNRLLF